MILKLGKLQILFLNFGIKVSKLMQLFKIISYKTCVMQMFKCLQH